MEIMNDHAVTIQLDLSLGNSAMLKSRESIQEYVLAVCRVFEIARIADITISPINDDKLAFMMSQFADKTMISGCFDSVSCTANIDFMTLKDINARDLVEITKRFFNAEKINHRSFVRN